MSIKRLKYLLLKAKYEWAARRYLKGSKLVEKYSKVLGVPLDDLNEVPKFVRHESGAFTLEKEEPKQNFFQRLIEKLRDEQQMRMVVDHLIPHIWFKKYNENHKSRFFDRLLDKYIHLYKHVPIPPEYSDPFDTVVTYRAGTTTDPNDTRDDATKANDTVKDEEAYSAAMRDYPVRKYTINKIAVVTLNAQKEFDYAIEELKKDENIAVIKDALKRSAEQERMQAIMDEKSGFTELKDEESLDIEKVVNELEDDEQEDAEMDGLDVAVRTALNASVMASINASVLH